MKKRSVAMSVMVVSFLLWGTAACGGDSGREDAIKEQMSTTADKFCGGAVSPDAERALALLTGTSDLHPTDADENVRTTADALIAGWAPFGPPPKTPVDHDLCSISTEKNLGEGRGDVRITFSLSDAEQAKGDGEIAKSLTPYEMGERASIGTERAYMWFSCKSAQLSGSEETPAHILGAVENWRDPQGEDGQLRDANATLLHSTSLALARQLACEGDGALQSKPALKHAT